MSSALDNYCPSVEFPDPTMDHAKWLFEVSKCTERFSLRDYRALGRRIKKGRLWTIEAGMRFNSGLANKVIGVELMVKDYGDGHPARINHFFMVDEAKEFWKTGIEDGQSPEDILKGWDSLQSIMADANGAE